jgi:hypothetical protein
MHFRCPTDGISAASEEGNKAGFRASCGRRFWGHDVGLVEDRPYWLIQNQVRWSIRDLRSRLAQVSHYLQK